MSATEMIVVRDDVGRAQMVKLALASGWPRTGQTDRGHLVMASEHWTPDAGVTVTWVENHTSDVRTVRVEGAPHRVERIATEVREALPHHDRASLLEAVHTGADPAQLIHLAGKLADCRPRHCDAVHLAALRALLSHEAVAVRRAAVRTAYLYPWPELVDIVAARYETDETLAVPLRHLDAFVRAQVP